MLIRIQLKKPVEANSDKYLNIQPSTQKKSSTNLKFQNHQKLKIINKSRIPTVNWNSNQETNQKLKITKPVEAKFKVKPKYSTISAKIGIPKYSSTK